MKDEPARLRAESACLNSYRIFARLHARDGGASAHLGCMGREFAEFLPQRQTSALPWKRKFDRRGSFLPIAPAAGFAMDFRQPHLRFPVQQFFGLG